MEFNLSFGKCAEIQRAILYMSTNALLLVGWNGFK